MQKLHLVLGFLHPVGVRMRKTNSLAAVIARYVPWLGWIGLCKLNLSSFKKNSGKIQPNSSPQRPYTMDILLMKSIQDQVLDLFKDEISTRLDKNWKEIPLELDYDLFDAPRRRSA